MRIDKVNVLSGPNYWSVNQHRLIVLTLQLEEPEMPLTSELPGFYERLVALFSSFTEQPSLAEVRNDFYSLVKEGTSVAEVAEKLAILLQNSAGIEAYFSYTQNGNAKGQHYVVFAYHMPNSGRYTGEAAVRIAEALVNNTPYDVQRDVAHIKALWEDEKWGPTTSSIADEAARRGIPILRLDDNSFVQLGWGRKQKRFEASITSCTASIAVDNAGCKAQTKKLLSENYIPVPEGRLIANEDELKPAIEALGYPLVIKPRDGNHGKGVTTNLHDFESCAIAFGVAKRFSEDIIVEQYVEGDDYRVLVVDCKFVAAAKRSPASVCGDGIHTIEQLIHLENNNPLRGDGHGNILTKIPLDELTISTVKEAGYNMNDVLPEGQILYVRKTANLSTGGTAENVTASVHPQNRLLFERAARVMGLDVCGLDIIAKDLSRPIKNNKGVIIEVNAAPGLRMHLAPSKGEPVNVAAPIVDMLFPNEEKGRIPIVAITGTNGKTTTRLIADMVRKSRRTVGYTTTDGIYIGDEEVTAGDCSGPSSAQVVLKDSSVEVAVLETARGGILRSGMGFDSCDVAVVTNIAEEHLGLGGIDTIEQLARVKSVVPRAVHSKGCAVLNADDDYVYDMRNRVSCKVALFSLHNHSQRVHEHCERGGTACYVDDGYIVLQQGIQRYRRVLELGDIPITCKGRAEFNVYNVLGAVLAAHFVGCSLHHIKSSLSSFSNNAKETPGRLNTFRFPNSEVMIDYAHNTHGMQAMGKFINHYPNKHKVAIIAGVGDRRDEDITSYAKAAAEIFDTIIIRMDKDTRGRCEEELSHLLRTGIAQAQRHTEVLEIHDEWEALQYAINTFTDDAFIFLGADDITSVLQRVEEAQNQLQFRQSVVLP